MSQLPSSVEAILPIGQFDIGQGGIITDSPANRELLDLIEQASPLSPFELYALAVSYQNVVSNSELGNHLAFIALNDIFQYPQIQRYQTALLQQNPGFTFDPCAACCALFGSSICNCNCRRPRISTTELKSVPVSGLNLLVEVTQADENKTYAILGTCPSILTSPNLPVQVQGGDPSSGGTPEQP